MNRTTLCCAMIVHFSLPAGVLRAEPIEEAALAKDVENYSKACLKRVEEGTEQGENYLRLAMGQNAHGKRKLMDEYFEKVAGRTITYYDLFNELRTDGRRIRLAQFDLVHARKHDPVVEFYLLMALDPDKTFADRGKKG